GPGAIETPLNAAWTGDEAKRAIVESHIPLGRVGTVEEIAAVFAFLASDDASYITGQTIYACGGITLFSEFRDNWASGGEMTSASSLRIDEKAHHFAQGRCRTTELNFAGDTCYTAVMTELLPDTIRRLYTDPGEYIDSDHPAVQDFARSSVPVDAGDRA